MDNVRERIMIVRLEGDLKAFLADSAYVSLLLPVKISSENSACVLVVCSRTSVQLGPMMSYHRRIVHHLAERFYLGHRVQDTIDGQRLVILSKTAASRVYVMYSSPLAIDRVSEWCLFFVPPPF